MKMLKKQLHLFLQQEQRKHLCVDRLRVGEVPAPPVFLVWGPQVTPARHHGPRPEAS